MPTPTYRIEGNGIGYTTKIYGPDGAEVLGVRRIEYSIDAEGLGSLRLTLNAALVGNLSGVVKGDEILDAFDMHDPEQGPPDRLHAGVIRDRARWIPVEESSPPWGEVVEVHVPDGYDGDGAVGVCRRGRWYEARPIDEKQVRIMPIAWRLKQLKPGHVEFRGVIAESLPAMGSDVTPPESTPGSACTVVRTTNVPPSADVDP